MVGNASGLRSDAIIVTAHAEPATVELLGLQPYDVEDQRLQATPAFANGQDLAPPTRARCRRRCWRARGDVIVAEVLAGDPAALRPAGELRTAAGGLAHRPALACSDPRSRAIPIRSSAWRRRSPLTSRTLCLARFQLGAWRPAGLQPVDRWAEALIWPGQPARRGESLLTSGAHGGTKATTPADADAMVDSALAGAACHEPGRTSPRRCPRTCGLRRPSGARLDDAALEGAGDSPPASEKSPPPYLFACSTASAAPAAVPRNPSTPPRRPSPQKLSPL